MNRLRNLGVNLLLAATSAALFMGALELACRWTEGKAASPARPTAAYITEWMDGTTGDGFFTVKSTAVGWPPWEDYNHDGVRDREHALEKPAGARRIVFLGDSVTLGYGVTPRQAFPQVVQDLVAARGLPIEVFNISLGGWSTRQELIAYRRIARPYRPDQVLLAICLNDIPEMENNLTKPAPWLMALYRRSALVRRAIGAQDREIHSVEELFTHPDSPKVKDAFRRMFEDIRTLDREVRADGASLAVLVLPFRFQVQEGAPPPNAQATIGAFCREQKIPFLDLLPAIKPKGVDAYYDYDHFSALGARTVAETVIASGFLAGVPSDGGPADAVAPASATQLVADLASPKAEKRAAAAWRLGQMGAPAREALPALIRALHDPDVNVRWRAGDAIADLGVDAHCCLAGLVDVLKRADGPGRGAAARLIGKIGADAHDAVPFLAEALRDPREDVRAQAVVALGQMGPAARPALPALIAAFEDAAVRWQVADALGSIDVESPAVVRVLTRGLQDPSSSVRWRAAGALDRLPSPDAELVAALLAVTSDSSENVRLAALKALSKAKGGATPLTPVFVKALRDPDNRIRGKAAEILGRTNAVGAVPELSPLLDDPDPTVRDLAARAIKKLKKQADSPA
jgi:HEAT repeat protein/lysophospholipase L1-like esterase